MSAKCKSSSRRERSTTSIALLKQTHNNSHLIAELCGQNLNVKTHTILTYNKDIGK